MDDAKAKALPMRLIKKVWFFDDPEEETEPLSIQELSQLWTLIDAVKELTQIKLMVGFDKDAL